MVIMNTRMLGIYAPIGEILSCEREVGNIHDTFAVAIKKDGKVVARKFEGESFGKSLVICQIHQNFLPPKFCIIQYNHWVKVNPLRTVAQYMRHGKM